LISQRLPRSWTLGVEHDVPLLTTVVPPSRGRAVVVLALVAVDLAHDGDRLALRDDATRLALSTSRRTCPPGVVHSLVRPARPPRCPRPLRRAATRSRPGRNRAAVVIVPELVNTPYGQGSGQHVQGRTRCHCQSAVIGNRVDLQKAGLVCNRPPDLVVKATLLHSTGHDEWSPRPRGCRGCR